MRTFETSGSMWIIGRAPPELHEYWIEKTVTDGLSIKALRKQIRKSRATYPEEPNDFRVKSFLETTRQYVRDFEAEMADKSPAYYAELAKILAPVVRRLPGLRAAA